MTRRPSMPSLLSVSLTVPVPGAAASVVTRSIMRAPLAAARKVNVVVSSNRVLPSPDTQSAFTCRVAWSPWLSALTTSRCLTEPIFGF